MKKKVLFLVVFAIVFYGVTSCKDEKENHKEKWMITNTGAINAIRGNPEYKEIKSLSNEGSIFYKVLKAGDGKDPILFTSYVQTYYKGWYIADYPQYNIKSGNTFDRLLFDDGPPLSFQVGYGGLITGWVTALQRMVKGDKWEIWIPYQLAYGRDDYQKSGRPPVPGYSTLVFELEVVNVSNKTQ